MSTTLSRRLRLLLDAVERLGFQRKHIFRSLDGQLQNVELIPNFVYKDQIRELSLSATLEEEGVNIVLELGLPSFFGVKEVTHEAWIKNERLEQTQELIYDLQQMLDELVSNPHPFAHSKKQKNTGIFGFDDEDELFNLLNPAKER